MCGRYTLATPALADLRPRFGLGERVELRRRFNVCPGDDVVTVVAGGDGRPSGELLRWGLVPFWARDPSMAYKMINARAETVAEKPAYRESFQRRRCLVVADGFYEWEQREAMPKLPWHVTREDGRPFAFAGLWSSWTAPDGSALRTCAIVTTSANPDLRAIHDRMPVILPGPAEESAWLSAETAPDELRDLLAPLPPERTARRAVGPAVNDARYDGPECLEPAPAEPEPLQLF